MQSHNVGTTVDYPTWGLKNMGKADIAMTVVPAMHATSMRNAIEKRNKRQTLNIKVKYSYHNNKPQSPVNHKMKTTSFERTTTRTKTTLLRKTTNIEKHLLNITARKSDGRPLKLD